MEQAGEAGEICERLKSGWNQQRRSSNAGANMREWRTVGTPFRRGRKHARVADRGDPIPPSHVVSFEDIESLLSVLTAKRVLLLRQVSETPASISDLAAKLKRDRSAVTRDIQLLEGFGILRVVEKPLPGHGRQKWIMPVAHDIQLTAQL